ncbi:phosphate ABC transporter permease PstA [Thermanaerovibrio acidaminovorans]|uniref:phosphate ABC transporter permease PstA n=1 Tax=Thermanaerovibrio acidaminovorans TaxID=81462 RepID=UPI002490F014|nr:phosphate ABC transporter permease PstA [Thermanaerovibrio acidaminovorans]
MKIRLVKDRLATGVLWLFTLITLGTLLGILGFLWVNGRSAVTWEFLTQRPRSGMTQGGIATPLVGTVQLMLLSMAFALPIGVATAVYLTEYAPKGPVASAVRLAVRSLAGVPSVVFGLFGLSFFCIFLRLGASMLSASLTLACLVLPVVVTAAETAILNVPKDLRDASFAMGATRWQTIRKVVLPTAMPSIMTGAILGLGRVAGETAPIMFTGAVFFTPNFAKSPFESVMALPYHIYVLATAGTNIDATRPIQYGTSLVLVGTVFLLSLTGIAWRSRLRRSGRA